MLASKIFFKQEKEILITTTIAKKQNHSHSWNTFPGRVASLHLHFSNRAKPLKIVTFGDGMQLGD